MKPSHASHLIVATAIALSGCEQPVDLQKAADEERRAENDESTVARLPADQAITLAQIDGPLGIALADLEMQAFRLRRSALEQRVFDDLLSRPVDERRAETMLQPPEPPRFSITSDPARTRPSSPAPVTIIAFCNFESPHCVRFEMTLAQVLPLFPGVVQTTTRDFFLPFHRSAPLAAQAARCAAREGRYWDFHDLLRARQSDLERETLEGIAALAVLSVDGFRDCLDSDEVRSAVEEDLRTASELGLDRVPGVFVNGRYLSPPVSAADLVWGIEGELAALNVPSPRVAPPGLESALPIEVRAVLHSSIPGQGVALLAPAATSQPQAFREGDALAPQIILRRITSDGIELWRDGSIETRTLGRSRPAASEAAREPPGSVSVPATPHRAVPIHLDRERVLVLMSDRIGLAEALEPVTMTAGGHRQLRITRVDAGSLYDLLGFEPGDVLLGVNEQPLHEGDNPLWEALEQEDEVRVRVMRPGGLARHFTYRFSAPESADDPR